MVDHLIDGLAAGPSGEEVGVTPMGFGESGVVNGLTVGVVNAEQTFFRECFALGGSELEAGGFDLIARQRHDGIIP
jgi:hypothetical protein